MRIYHYLSGQLLQTISVKTRKFTLLKVVCIFQISNASVMFLYVLLAACVLMFAQELLRFRYVRHIPLLSLASLCQDAAQPRIPPSASLLRLQDATLRGGEKFSEFFPR